jgi:hypothetical protein
MNKQKEKLAIIVPYRDRKEHLSVFVPYINNFMKSHFHQIEYKIFIIEQFDNLDFNRGILLNIGVILAKDYDYFILHDIDLLPISADYRYIKETHHLSRFIYEQNYDGKLKHNYACCTVSKNIAGGVLKVSKDAFFKINGFFNDCWGWGGEDDILKFRLISINKPPMYNEDEGFFITLNHEKNFISEIHKRPNTKISKKHRDDLKNNNLDISNGISTLSYNLIKTEYHDGYILHSVVLKQNIKKNE